MSAPAVNLWTSPAHALEYLTRADKIPHRTEGEKTLLDCLPEALTRVLDLGSGAGRLLDLVKLVHPGVQAVALDFSPAMLEQLREHFDMDPSVTIVAHNLDDPLPDSLGLFDAVVSSFAIHHVVDARKRGIYEETFERLVPGGVFCNLEHVASPTAALHEEFLSRLVVPRDQEDPSNKLTDMNVQLTWLREIGFADVDCLWKWRELALLFGRKA